LTDPTAPIITDTGARIPRLRFGDPRAHALLQALLIHRLLPHGFTDRDLRALIAPLLGVVGESSCVGGVSRHQRPCAGVEDQPQALPSGQVRVADQ
jgi:hypothetical protein